MGKSIHETRVLYDNYHLFVNRFVLKYKKDIQQLFQFDSKLFYIIPYICPQEDTSFLSDILPLELAIVWLIERLNLSSESHNLRLSTITDFKVCCLIKN